MQENEEETSASLSALSAFYGLADHSDTPPSTPPPQQVDDSQQREQHCHWVDDRGHNIVEEAASSSTIPQGKTVGFFSRVASRVIGKMSSSSSSSSLALISKETLSQEQRLLLLQLGLQMNEDFEDILSRFNELSENGNKGRMNATVRLEKFVLHMIQRGAASALWADAAFRAFDSSGHGEMSFFEFLLADVSLRLGIEYKGNESWLSLRRQVVFTVYDREIKGALFRKDVYELLGDMSSSDKEPDVFGKAKYLNQT